MSTTGPILLLEDELPAARKAHAYLAKFCPDATVAHVRSIRAARAWLKKHPRPSLIVSDIELLDGSAFELFGTDPPGVPILFLTAYPQHRAAAFETDGIGYLVKPYGEEAFAAAWAKIERLTQGASSGDTTSPREPLRSKLGGTIRLVPLVSIAYFQSEGEFVVAVNRDGQRFPLTETLAELEEQVLDPQSFFRISRSAIVARQAVASYRPFRKNRLTLALTAPAGEHLETSNRHGPAFKRWLARD